MMHIVLFDAALFALNMPAATKVQLGSQFSHATYLYYL